MLAGCGGELKGEVDGQKFVRCAQTQPVARTYRAGSLVLTVQDRTLQVDGATRLAAFTGPVGRAFTAEDVAQLEDGELALWLGGLGDTAELARDNLTRLAARRVPTLFIAGGADRWPIVERAFAALPEDVPIVQGSGLRKLRLGAHGFAIAAGAPRGRYALDEQSCGLTPEDVTAIQSEAAGSAYLLSWHAPSSSPELSALSRVLNAASGLWAFPEPEGPAASWTVPRLGAPGTQRGDGARLKSRVGHFLLGASGLQPRP
ncbi:MAG TPA: hypothetical protein VFX59_08960 [Polyangiales bacterium]|nr:hypothetical protein [Polyangiales bacterium]